MKRGRKTQAEAAPALPLDPALRAQLRAQLAQDYAAFVGGTATEDPKLFLARIAAAKEALEQLQQLDAKREAGAAEPTEEEVLAAARATIASENKT
jgi:hypothetical protein